MHRETEVMSELKCKREYQKCWGFAREVLSEKLIEARLRV